MIDESNININLLGGLGENQIPGLTDNEAIFPGSEKLITEFPSNLSSDIAGGEEAIDYSLAILGDSEGANADLTGSDEGETLRATRSKSSAEKVDSLTGEVIETSAIETRSGNSDFIKVEEVFNYGYFVADETGEINIDYLHDGTRPEGELAIFSLEDFDKSFLESEKDFIEEATRRAFSNSELGSVLINDTTEGAYFGGWADKGEYQGLKTFNLTPGDKYAFAMVPNGTIKEVLDNPKAGGNKKPLFSLSSEEYDYLPGKQFADVTGSGEILGIESSSVNNPRSDKDYDDLVINIEGLTGTVSPFDEVIKEGKDWREKRLGKQLNDYAKFPDISLDSGKFVADASGELKIDYVYDGTGHQGELAIFSLDGLAELNLKSKKDFIEEAASRALSNSERGYVVVSDKTEGAYLDGWANKGEHQGVKSFNLKPGDEYAFMVVPNGTVKEVLDNPNIGGSKQPLFSVFDEDNEDYLSGKQFADVTGNGDVLGIETSPVDRPSSDKDYEDVIVHIEGLTGTGSPFDEVIKEGKDWREKRLGKQIDDYVKFPDISLDSGKFVADASGELKIDYVYDGTGHQGELAIFSLDGLAELNLKSKKDFIEEAASRALSNSERGYVVVSDKTEGAYLDGWANKGEHQGVKSFNLKPGDEYAFMIVPNGTVKEVLDNPNIGGSKQPLFSVFDEDNEDYLSGKQFADVTGNGDVLGIESSPVNHPSSDKDYEDLIVHIEGLTGTGSPFDEVIKEGKDWREKSVGKRVREYIDLSEISFDAGEFVVGESGEVTVDFLFDGGGYKSQLAIFSLEDLEAKSYADFVKQAAERALSNSELGYIAISDAAEGAKFIGELGEKNQNSGEYLGVKTFNLNPGEKFALMFVPNGSVEDVFNNPTVGGSKAPFFSLVTDDPDDKFSPGQMADVTGEGVIFAFEDINVSNERADRDYNDFVFSLNGVEDASEVVVHLDEAIDPGKDWREIELGQELIDSLEQNPPLPPGEINSPQDLFLLKDLLYNPGETLEILGKVSDTDGGGDMARIDFWLQQDGGQWEDIADVTEFEVDGDEARFDYELAGLEAGQYQLKAIAYDLDGNSGDELTEGFTVLSLTPGEELSSRVIWAIERSMNLDTYDPDALAATREWVVSVKAGESAAELAESFGAQNLGPTGHIPNTYIWEFPAKDEPAAVKSELDKSIAVEYGYPLVPIEAKFFSPSGAGDTLLDQQWHLENTGQTGGTAGEDAKVKAAWELGYKGSDVVIGVVDDGFDLTHPDLQPNNLTELNYDFDQGDDDPSYLLTTTFEERLLHVVSGSEDKSKPQFFELDVKDLNGYLNNVTVGLKLNKHADMSDWDLSLISPQGTRIELFAGESGNGSFTATTSAFKGESPRTDPYNQEYTWILEIQNSSDNDDAVISSWSLELETIQGHGTQVTGVAAAKGGKVAGVAPEASWAGLRLGADNFLPTEIAAALSWKKDEIDIYSNSWGAGFFGSPSGLSEYSLSKGIKEGRDGLGNIYVFSAGNDGEWGDDVNYNSLANSRHSIAVGAIDHDGEQIDYSTPGAPLLISAPSKNIQYFLLPEDFDSKKIEDGKTISSKIDVSDVAGKLTDLEVNLEIDHTDYQDLTVTLVSPSGTAVELFADAAFTNISPFAIDVEPSISLSDSTAKEIPTTEDTVFMGSYRPKGNLSDFQGLEGEDANGEWKLEITDEGGNGSKGKLNDWYLNIGTGGIVTTAAGDGYAKDFSGTSASTPLVSGAIALMLDANEYLSWRDVQQIIIDTADRIETTDPKELEEGWAINLAGHHVNHQYGFGTIDVKEAVATALDWKEKGKTLDKEVSISSGKIDVSEVIEDASKTKSGDTVSGDTVTSTINFDDSDKELNVEWAEVHFTAQHDRPEDLEIVLVHTYTDTEYTESVLAKDLEREPGFERENYDWLFTSARHWGELSSAGTWELRVTDKRTGEQGEFGTWELNLYGTKTNTAPTLNLDLDLDLDQKLNYTEEKAIALQDIVITDPDTGDTISVTLELNNPAGGSIASPADESDADGELSFEGSLADVNTWLAALEFKPAEDFTDNLEIAVAVTDNNISRPITGTIALVGKTDNDPPTVANAIADQAATEGELFELVLGDTFEDVDDDELNYSATVVDGGELPEWLSFDAATGTFSGTPENSDIEEVEVKVTAADDDGAEVSDEFVVTVENVNDPPTVANEIADQTATVGEIFRFAFPEDTFADVDGGDRLFYNVTLEDGSSLPGWLFFSNDTRTFLAIMPGNEDVGSFNVKVEAMDRQDASVSDVFALTVGLPNNAPTLTEVSTLTGATEGEGFTISYDDLLDASDATDVEGDTISFQIEGLLSGELTKDGETVAIGETVLSEGEEIVWTPDVVGDAVEALSVKAFDGKEYSDVAVEVQVAVNENLSAPPWENVVFGIKSTSVDNARFPSNAPAHLFWFGEDSARVADLGALTRNGEQIDADGLAISRNHGLLAFEITDTDSTLISIDPDTAVATTLGEPLTGKDIRGAAFDRNDNLWALDAEKDQLLLVDPENGSVLQSLTMTLEGESFDVYNATDLAIDFNGTFYLSRYFVNPDNKDDRGAGIFTLEPKTGVLTYKGHDELQGLPGLTFSQIAPENQLFAYEVNSDDDILIYDKDADYQRQNHFSDILPTFNSGRGDLAALLPPAPEGEDATENILYLNSVRTGNRGNYRSVIADFIDDYEDGNVFDVDFVESQESGDLASYLNAKPIDYYDQVWFDSTIRDTSLLNPADLEALNAWSANQQPEFILDSSYFARNEAQTTMNASAGALTVNQALALKDAGGGILIGTDHNSYANTANQVLTNFGFDELLTGRHTINANSSFAGDLLLAPNSVEADFFSTLEGFTVVNVPVGTHVLNENGGNRTIEIYESLFSLSPDKVVHIGTSFDTPIDIPGNAPPELNAATLTGGTYSQPYTITYDSLLAASGATDADGDALTFQVREVLSGELTKDGETVGQLATLSEGEEIVWTPDEVGDAVEALSVKAFDGKEYSDVAVEVEVEVAEAISTEPFVKLGDERQVNTYTDGNQAHPEVAALADGGYIVTWHSDAQDGSEYGIYAQRYDSTGNRVGDELQINTYTSNNQWYPSATGLPDGGFVVAWHSAGQDGSGFGIYGQRYDSTGNPVGEEFQVNTQTDNSQTSASVKALADGGFVVSWESYQGSNSQYPIRISAQRYDSTGNPVGSEFQIDTEANPESQSLKPEIAVLEDEGFVATWFEGVDLQDYEVYAARYDSNSNPIGEKFQVNSYANDGQYWQSVAALADGGLAMVWTSIGQDGSALGIYGQRYDGSGNPVGDEFQVNTYSDGEQIRSSVTALEDGGFVVSWQSEVQDGSGWGVFGQRFDGNGNKAGEEFQINTYTDTDQRLPSMATLANGQFVVAWASLGQDGSESGIYAQRFGVNTAPTLTEVSTLTGASQGEAFTITYDNLLAASNAADAEGDTLTFQIEGLLSGELTKDGETVSPSATVLKEGEEIVWTPDVVGDAVEALSVKAFDGKEYSDVAVEVAVAVAEPKRSGPKFEWARSTGGDSGWWYQGRTIATDSDRNVLVTGWFENTTDIDGDGNNDLTSNGSDDSYVAKLDSSGNLLWAKNIGGSGTDMGYGIATDSDSNVLITGYFQGSIDIDSDGKNDLIGNAGRDSYIAKLDSDGNLLWARDIASTSGDLGHGIAADSDGNVLITGSFQSTIDIDSDGNNDLTSNGKYDSYIAKFDSDGNLVWAENIGGTDLDEGYGIAADNNGDVLVTGYFRGSIDIDSDGNNDLTSNGGEDAYVAKFDSSGNLVWSKAIGGSNGDKGWEIITDSKNNALVTGTFQNNIDIDSDGSNDLTSNGGEDAYVAKLDSNGNLVWAENIGGTGRDRGRGIVTDSSSNVLVTGAFESTIDIDSDGNNDLTSNGGQDGYVAKFDSSGNLVWAENIGDRGTDIGVGIAVDNSGSILAKGWFENTIDIDKDGKDDLNGNHNFDSYVVKLSTGENENTAPTLTNISTLTGATEGEDFTITYNNLLAASNATDADGDALTFQIEESFSGSLTKNGETVSAGATVLKEGEEIVWTPDVVGDAVEALSVKAFDGKESSDTAIEVTVAVLAPPEPFVKLGGEIRVNTHADNYQRHSDITHLSDGGYIITWESRGQDGSQEGVYGQRYDSNKAPVGNEFQINSHTNSQQLQPSVADLPDGGFLVTWASLGQYGNKYSIFGQRYDKDSDRAGDEFRISSDEAHSETFSSVSTLADGSFVVAWDTRNANDLTAHIRARLYDPDSNPVGDEFEIDSYSYTNGEWWIAPEVAALENGEFVVTWSAENADRNYEVYGQRFDSDGKAIGDEFQANTHTSDKQYWQSVAALSGGGYVISWMSEGQDGSDSGIYGQRYDSSGNPVGEEFQVNTQTDNQQERPSVTGQADGGFLITWQSMNQDSSNLGVFGQRYDSDGNPVGEEFQVNTYTESAQTESSAAALPDGEIVVAWSSFNQDGSGYGIYAQRFGVSTPNTAPTLTNIALTDVTLEEAASPNPTLNADNGNYYEFVPGEYGWQEAKARAEARTYNGSQGYLATITSEAEQQFVSDNFNPDKWGGWIGASDAAEEGVWQWETGPEAGTVFLNNGTATGYHNFAPTQPNNFLGVEEYAHIRPDDNGRWNDAPNNLSGAQPENRVVGYYVEYGGIESTAKPGEVITITFDQLLAASDAEDAEEGDGIAFQIAETFSGQLTKYGEEVVPGETLFSQGEELVWIPGEYGDTVKAFSVKAYDWKEYSDTAVDVVLAVEKKTLT